MTDIKFRTDFSYFSVFYLTISFITIISLLIFIYGYQFKHYETQVDCTCTLYEISRTLIKENSIDITPYTIYQEGVESILLLIPTNYQGDTFLAYVQQLRRKN
jgi:hypothetical protein